MRGAEHYLEAERRLLEAQGQIPGSMQEQRHVEYAKVHALLALAAAAALRACTEGGRTADEWAVLIAVPPPAVRPVDRDGWPPDRRP